MAAAGQRLSKAVGLVNTLRQPRSALNSISSGTAFASNWARAGSWCGLIWRTTRGCPDGQVVLKENLGVGKEAQGSLKREAAVGATAPSQPAAGHGLLLRPRRQADRHGLHPRRQLTPTDGACW